MDAEPEFFKSLSRKTGLPRIGNQKTGKKPPGSDVHTL